MSERALERRVLDLAARGVDANRQEVRSTVNELLAALEAGRVRAASPQAGRWIVHPWVKTGILLGFRWGEIVPLGAAPLTFADKDLFPPRPAASLDGVRVVPGGSAVRRGAFVGPGSVLMPPCYVNVGAFVGAGSMIDSHALVGSCAQVGERVHLSAGAQVGGVLEPPQAAPVILEDDVFVGALAGLLEGVRVRAGAVIGAGVLLTRSTPVFDIPRRQLLRATGGGALEIPERAVVIPGSRPLSDPWARECGVQAQCAVIVKVRDASTDARAALEEALR